MNQKCVVFSSFFFYNFYSALLEFHVYLSGLLVSFEGILDSMLN